MVALAVSGQSSRGEGESTVAGGVAWRRAASGRSRGRRALSSLAAYSVAASPLLEALEHCEAALHPWTAFPRASSPNPAGRAATAGAAFPDLPASIRSPQKPCHDHAQSPVASSSPLAPHGAPTSTASTVGRSPSSAAASRDASRPYPRPSFSACRRARRKPLDVPARPPE